MYLCSILRDLLNFMKIDNLFYLLSINLLFTLYACHSSNTQSMNKQNNPLLCDTETGICEVPNVVSEENMPLKDSLPVNKLKVIYFTDPICSSCWGIEPQLRKLKLEYGKNLEIEYRMGGLLPDWSYNSGGISKPSDVAHHWDEVSEHYDMPIDGDVWLEDPLHSSYPPSIAFKAAQLQDKQKAISFLREIREMVFLHKKNITKWENLELAARKVDLDVKRFNVDYEENAKFLFEEDLKLAREMGVRGFPTLFFINDQGNKEIVYGTKPYAYYEMAILKLHPSIVKSEYSKNWETIFNSYTSLCAKEFAELTGTPRTECEAILNNLVKEGKLTTYKTKNGSIWLKK